jgi:site-specific DNA-methyltransferase (adenine-specific)
MAPAHFDPKQLAREGSFTTDLGVSIVGNCLDVLRQVPDDSLDLVITSPPMIGRASIAMVSATSASGTRTPSSLKATSEVLRVLQPRGSFVLNYRSKRHGGERGTLQYELVFWLREQGFLFCEDFVWGKPSPPPGRFNRFAKDAVEYCFQFAKTPDWQFYPDNCLTPARWDAKDRERRRRLPQNFVRVNEPSGHGRHRVNAGPDMVRPSTLLHFEPEFGPNPTSHPARFPVERLPSSSSS